MILSSHKYFRKYLILIASLLLASCVVIEANATTLVHMDLAALARSAEIIVRALYSLGNKMGIRIHFYV